MAESPKRFSATTWVITAAAVVILVAGLRAAETLVVPVVFAVFLSILGSPLVAWLKRHRVPTVLAVLVVVLGIMGTLTAVGALVGNSVGEFANTITGYRERFDNFVVSATEWLRRHGLKVSSAPLAEALDPSVVLETVTRLLKGVMAALSNMLLVLLTMTFMLLESAAFSSKLQLAFGERIDAARFTKVVTDVQRYLAVKTVTSGLTGLMVGLWVTLMHVDFPWLWGLLAFLLNYIPVLGSIMAAIPAVLLNLVQAGLGSAFALSLGYLVVNISISNVLEPQLMGRRLGLSPLVVFLSLVSWGWIWGPAGMLLSVPLTMIAKILCENSEGLHWIAIMLDNKPRQTLPRAAEDAT